MSKFFGLGFVLLALCHTSQAALINAGNGLINDTTQKITWMKDANLLGTLCKADVDKLLSSFVEESDHTLDTLCGRGGRLDSIVAAEWLDHLNSRNYLGFDDWRFPKSLIFDPTCENTLTVGTFGINCRSIGNEFGYLYNISLDNPNGFGNGSTGGKVGTNCWPRCLKNTGPFDHVEYHEYFLSQSKLQIGSSFDTRNGYQGGWEFDQYLWLVRSGNIPIQAPPKKTVNDEIILTIGKPKNDEKLTGTATITGWTVSPDGIAGVELYVDDVFYSSIPQGGARPDVNVAFPGYPNALNSGFVMTYPTGNLTPGVHRFSVYAYDKKGKMNFVSTDVIVDKFEVGWSARSEVELGSAVVRKSGDAIYVDGIKLKGSPNNVKMQWDQTSQSFSVTEIE